MDLRIGIYRGYNEDGSLNFEKDYTRPEFTFTIDQLAKKIKKDYGIDLYNDDELKLIAETWWENNGTKKFNEWWVVCYMDLPSGLKHVQKTIRINAETGEFVAIENEIPSSQPW